MHHQVVSIVDREVKVMSRTSPDSPVRVVGGII